MGSKNWKKVYAGNMAVLLACGAIGGAVAAFFINRRSACRQPGHGVVSKPMDRLMKKKKDYGRMPKISDHVAKDVTHKKGEAGFHDKARNMVQHLKHGENNHEVMGSTRSNA